MRRAGQDPGQGCAVGLPEPTRADYLHPHPSSEPSPSGRGGGPSTKRRKTRPAARLGLWTSVRQPPYPPDLATAQQLASPDDQPRPGPQDLGVKGERSESGTSTSEVSTTMSILWLTRADALRPLGRYWRVLGVLRTWCSRRFPGDDHQLWHPTTWLWCRSYFSRVRQHSVPSGRRGHARHGYYDWMGVGGCSPRSTARALADASVAIAVRVSIVAEPRCGISTTLSSSQQSGVHRRLALETSRPAPAI